MPGLQGGPLMHVIAAKAIAFGEALTDNFDKYIVQVMNNSKTMADELMKKGFNLVSGGTDNHLMLVDLQNKNITGKEAQNDLTWLISLVTKMQCRTIQNRRLSLLVLD